MALLELSRPWILRRRAEKAEVTAEPPLSELAQVLNQATLTLAQENHDPDLQLTRTFTRGDFSRTTLTADGKKVIQYAIDICYQKGSPDWHALLAQADQLETVPECFVGPLKTELELGQTLETQEHIENLQALFGGVRDHLIAHQHSLITLSRKGNPVLSQEGKAFLHAAYNWQRRLFANDDSHTFQTLRTQITDVFSGGGIESLARVSLLGKLRWEETLAAYHILEQQLPEELRSNETLQGAALIQSRLKQALTQVETKLGHEVDASFVIERFEEELRQAEELEEQEIAAKVAALAALPKWRQAWAKIKPVKSMKRVAYGIFSGLAISTLLVNPLAVCLADLFQDLTTNHPSSDPQPDVNLGETGALGSAINHTRLSHPSHSTQTQPATLSHTTDHLARPTVPHSVETPTAPTQEVNPTILIGPISPDSPLPAADSGVLTSDIPEPSQIPDSAIHPHSVAQPEPQPTLLVQAWEFFSQQWQKLTTATTQAAPTTTPASATEAAHQTSITADHHPVSTRGLPTPAESATSAPEPSRTTVNQQQVDQFHQALTSDQAQIVIHGGPHLNDLNPDDQVFQAQLRLSVPIGPGVQYPDRPADSLHVHPIDARVVNPTATPTTDPTPVTDLQIDGVKAATTLRPALPSNSLGTTFIVPIENVVEFQANPQYQGIITLNADKALHLGDSVTVTTPQGDLAMEVVAKTTQAPDGSLNAALYPLNLDAAKLTLVITNCGEPEVVGNRLTNAFVDRVIVVLQPQS